MLTDHAAVSAHRNTIAAARKDRRGFMSWALAMRGALEDADPTASDPQYEGHRQRLGAIERTLAEIREKEHYLLQTLGNLTDDMLNVGMVGPGRRTADLSNATP